MRQVFTSVRKKKLKKEKGKAKISVDLRDERKETILIIDQSNTLWNITARVENSDIKRVFFSVDGL